MRCIQRFLVLTACVVLIAGSAGCSSAPSSAPRAASSSAPTSSSPSTASQGNQEKSAGQPAGQAAAESGQGSDTPQGVFDKATAAQKGEDFKTYVGCLSPGAQKQLAEGLAFGAVGQQNLAHSPGGEKFREQFKPVLAVLDKHGLSYDTTKKFKLDLTDRKALEQARREIQTLIKDPAAFAADMMEAYAKLQSAHGAKKPQVEPKLTDVKVEGDKATGTLVVTMDGKEQKQPIEFVKVGGSWKFAPQPGALGPPGGR